MARRRCWSARRLSASWLRSRCAKPRMPLSGVRSSWLTRARNSLLAWLAWRAASRSARACSMARRWVTSATWPCHSVTPLASRRGEALNSCQAVSPSARRTRALARQVAEAAAAASRERSSAARSSSSTWPNTTSAEARAAWGVLPYSTRTASLTYGKCPLPSGRHISWKIMPGASSAARLTRSISSSTRRRWRIGTITRSCTRCVPTLRLLAYSSTSSGWPSCRRRLIENSCRWPCSRSSGIR